MELLLRDKFRRNKDIRERLKLTNNRILINTYTEHSASNLFWGNLKNIIFKVQQMVKDKTSWEDYLKILEKIFMIMLNWINGLFFALIPKMKNI